MALKFVTAKAGVAHISSADWKSLNRGIMGRGKYILIDTENNSQNEYIFSPAQGEVSIPPCSLMWSGAHIRNTTTTVLKYTPPTVDSTINVWLHYLKDADSGVETLDFVTTINEQPSPIYDEIEDGTLEAYTSLCYFTHKADSTEVDYPNMSFEQINTIEGLRGLINELNAALEEEVENRISNDNEHNTKISAFGEAIGELQQKTITLSDSMSAYPTVYGVTIASSDDDISNFKCFILLRAKRGSSNTIRETYTLPARYGEYYVPQTFVESVALTSATKTTIINATVKIVKSTSEGFYLSHHSGVTADSDYFNQLDYFTTVIGVK